MCISTMLLHLCKPRTSLVRYKYSHVNLQQNARGCTDALSIIRASLMMPNALQTKTMNCLAAASAVRQPNLKRQHRGTPSFKTLSSRLIAWKQ